MAITNEKLNHSLMIARLMRKFARELYDQNDLRCREMFILGFLHDVSDEFADKEHDKAMISYILLSKGGYKYADEIMTHIENKTASGKTDDYKSEELELLNLAHLCVADDTDEIVPKAVRLKRCANRYGEDSNLYRLLSIIEDDVDKDTL